MLIIFQTVCSLCKTCAALWPKAFSLYTWLIIWNLSLADLPNFWQNLTFSHCPNCDILCFRRSQTPSPHNGDFLSEYTARTRKCFLLRREKNERCTISWLHVSVAVLNNAPMRPIREI
jgi:hypothetical protein